MKKKIDYFDLILKIFIILVFILVTYWFFELLFGGSPTLTEFGAVIIVATFGYILKINREVGEIKVDMKHNINNTRQSFKIMKDDIDLIKKKLNIYQ
jgi:hypothetical protein